MATVSAPNAEHTGAVIAVRGSVVDAHFPRCLPALRQQLRAGRDQTVIIEVSAHLSTDTVRGVALTSTQGLARGDPVYDSGGPLTVPVGPELLGRMINVFGQTIDDGLPLTGSEWRSIHQPPIPLAQRRVGLEKFKTGIKVIDLLCPLERGGKAGLFGGAGVRVDRQPSSGSWGGPPRDLH